jgi:hypothetical protein
MKRFVIIDEDNHPFLTDFIGLAEASALNLNKIVIDTELEVLMTPNGNQEIKVV